VSNPSAQAPASHPRVLSRAIRIHIFHHFGRRSPLGMRIERAHQQGQNFPSRHEAA
jgi:hypothetical protein